MDRTDAIEGQLRYLYAATALLVCCTVMLVGDRAHGLMLMALYAVFMSSMILSVDLSVDLRAVVAFFTVRADFSGNHNTW